MPIPDFQSIMLPLLRLTGDGKEHAIRDVIDQLEDEFRLTEEERKQLLPSGQETTFRNRVAWARTYLKKAGLLEAPRRGWIRITPRGSEVLMQNPNRIDIRYLEQFQEFQDFRSLSRRRLGDQHPDEGAPTPEELLADAYERLRQALAAELLEQVRKVSPASFERLVIELLVGMGYGGSYAEAARAVGRSGDGGIDGIISEDRLGLDVIYLQAKRWEAPVGRPEVQKFAGALQGLRARKGVFITTSTFTQDAIEYAQRIDSKIVLIDGLRLVDLMIEHNLGVSPVTTYEVKKVDYDFFEGE